MKKIKWSLLPILIIGFLSFTLNVNAEEREDDWHLKASRVEVADVLENWLRKVMWSEKNSTELQLQALDAWIRIQPFTSKDGVTQNSPILLNDPGWTKLGGRIK